MIQKNKESRFMSAFAVALIVLMAVFINTAFAATEKFPIKGTSSKDTIEVRQLVETKEKMFQVYINGKIVNYIWEDGDNVRDRVIEAGAGDDKITISSKYGFTIYGECGEDVIQGGSGNDIILGGSGGDEIKGGDGNDWIKGGDHKDHIEGGPGNDVIYGNGAEDTLRGGAGNDLIDGGNGEDKIWGDNGDDQLYGEASNDQIRGGNDNDLIRGGAGNDKIRGDSGKDILLGESGNNEKEDSSYISADDYEDDREAEIKSIKDDFGVGVIDYGRKWTPEELGFLRMALEKMPDKVLDMWNSLGGKIKYHRKEVCKLKGTDEYTASGLTSTGIYLYDLNWANNTSYVQKTWIKTILHETGHAYKESPAMTSCQWKEWRELSGWEGSWPGGTPTNPNACFVSDYAKTNAKEDWAESFELYFYDPASLKKLCPAKYDFIHNIFP